MRWLRRALPFVRLQLATSEEAFEGILLGRWDGHYRLENATLVTATKTGTDTRKLDGLTAVREDRVLCYQVLDKVWRA